MKKKLLIHFIFLQRERKGKGHYIWNIKGIERGSFYPFDGNAYPGCS